jgi:hypothetical protein
MSTNRRLLELALKGLDAERSGIDQEIADLTAQIKRQEPVKPLTGLKPSAGAARTSSGRSRLSAAQRKKAGGLTAAGRKKLSEAAKRRWAANRKTGKTTL